MTNAQAAAIQKTCCFTGHRLIEESDFSSLQQSLEHTVRRAIEEFGFCNFIAGGALGFDTLASETLLLLKKDYPQIRLLLALPCPEQARYFKKADILRYERILNFCDKYVYVSPHYTPSCMHERNRFLVDHSSLCIAYLREGAKGGTAYTVSYAKEKGVPCINLFN